MATVLTVRIKDAKTDRNKGHGLFLWIKFLFGKETGTPEACKYVNVLPRIPHVHTRTMHTMFKNNRLPSLSYVLILESMLNNKMP